MRTQIAGLMATILLVGGILAALAGWPFFAGLLFLGWIFTTSLFDTLRSRLSGDETED